MDSYLVERSTNEMASANLKFARTVKIPLKIMQTWKTKDIPRKWQASADAIKKHMSKWTYTLMTDDDNLAFVKRYFPDFLSFYQGFEYPIQRADAIRYMWFYVNGGLYLDLDLEIIKPLDELFYDDHDLYVVKSSFMNSVYTNAFVAAKPQLRVMLQCLEEMKAPLATWHVGKHLKVVNSTGPNMFTKAVNKIKDENTARIELLEADGKFIRRGDKFLVKELPSELIISCSICDPKPCCIEGGYCRILGGTSWSGNDTEFLTFLYCNRYVLGTFITIVVIMLIIVVLLLIRRQRRKRNAGQV